MDCINLGKQQLKNIKKESETDSDSCIANESDIKVALCKTEQLDVLSTSEFEETDEINTKNTISSNIVWTSSKFTPEIHDFTPQHSGIQANINDSWKIIDYFQLFFSEELVAFIIEKTNNYWRRNDNSFVAGTELEEFYCFIAISMLMTRNKKLSIAEYWSKNNLLRSDIFGQIMSKDRYLVLLRMLNFTDDDTSNSDHLWKIRDIIDRLRRSFSNSFYPYQNLCIDESLLLYKGRLSFEQSIPSKGNGFGIKSFILCDCKTGYVQDFITYSGPGTITSHECNDIGISGSIVMSLLKPYLGKGHVLYVDNWYTSPALFSVLHRNATNACGTVKRRRMGMPKMNEKLKKGEACFRSSANLLAMKWNNKKNVYMISTMHTEDSVDVPKRYKKEEIVQKPACVHDYNSLMEAVDKTDMVISTIQSTRKTIKWYKKFFFHMVDMCLWNSYCIYKLETNKTISMAEFHLKLISQILERYQKSTTHHSNKLDDNHLSRLIERHFPSPYTSAGKNKLRRCVVCSANDKRRESRYHCEECDVGLCVFPCFKIYHTELYC